MSEQRQPPLLHEMNPPSPWQPTTDKIQLAALGKLLEELNECGAIVARCIIQGIDEKEPVTGAVNHEELAKEIADVFAAASVAVNVFGLSAPFILNRQDRKTRHLRAWHQMLKTADGEAQAT